MFLRIEKAVAIPDDDLVDLNNTAFGPNIAQGMKEIVGYAPIEPDGSVRVKVPANVPLAISVLDSNGRRITARHQAWLQLRPGEELRCNGCHDAQSGLSHGRGDSFDSIYPGAQNATQPFPNTVSSLFAEFGETMAEVRTRLDASVICPPSNSPVCDGYDALLPSMDLIYNDIWTDPTQPRLAGQRTLPLPIRTPVLHKLPIRQIRISCGPDRHLRQCGQGARRHGVEPVAQSSTTKHIFIPSGQEFVRNSTR